MSIKIFAIVAVLLVATAGAAGAIILMQDDDSQKNNVLTDARGRDVEIPTEINSILAIKSCSLELVSFFNAVDKVTHIDINERFEGSDNRTHGYILKDKVGGLPVVDPKSVEQVIASGVDIVISSTVAVSDLDKEQADYGVPVFAINADLEFGDAFYNQIYMLGKLFGEEDRADELVTGIEDMISDITTAFLPSDGDSVTYEVPTAYACGMNFMGMGSLLKTSGDYLPFEYSHIKNVMPSSSAGVGKQPYNIGIETLIDADPQFIFIDGGNYEATVKEIRDKNNVLKTIDAIKEGNIYSMMVYKSWGTNWQNQLINVYYVAEITRGDYFDWNFEEEANKIIQLFHPGTDVTYAELASVQSGNGCHQVPT